MAADGTDGSADGIDRSADGTDEVGGRRWVGGRHRWVGRLGYGHFPILRRHCIRLFSKFHFLQNSPKAQGDGCKKDTSLWNPIQPAGSAPDPPVDDIWNPFFTSTRTPIATAIRGKTHICKFGGKNNPIFTQKTFKLECYSIR